MFFKNQRIGKYEIIDTIGTGGFGSVYLAKDIMIDKKVAIKVPHKQGENVEKLLREPRLLAALNHPNIVSVITADKLNDVFYIVMEYVDGESLEQLLRRSGPPPLDTAINWFMTIADALAYAHDKNVLHRDIRPANILISKEGHLKVADLGTSRYLVDQHFASTRIGSPPYMAPEHFQGKATLQSDIYSFGILMYETLTGKLPYYDKNPKVLAQLARGGQAQPLTELDPNIPVELERIVLRAMHPRLSTRYATVRDLTADLQRRLRPVISSSQELAHLVDAEAREPKRSMLPKNIPTKEISRLFCWNCSRPVQKRTRSCPHCGVSLD
ncbi:MAG: protein kinase [Acidobacteriota bacterium]|nr:protein kinase [Acidobacteriota bacterium]